MKLLRVEILRLIIKNIPFHFVTFRMHFKGRYFSCTLIHLISSWTFSNIHHLDLYHNNNWPMSHLLPITNMYIIHINIMKISIPSSLEHELWFPTIFSWWQIEFMKSTAPDMTLDMLLDDKHDSSMTLSQHDHNSRSTYDCLSEHNHSSRSRHNSVIRYIADMTVCHKMIATPGPDMTPVWICHNMFTTSGPDVTLSLHDKHDSHTI